MTSSLSEFALIEQFFTTLSQPRNDVILGIGDDCALMRCPADMVVAVSIDTLVEGVHFFADVDPYTLGHKCLAVGLSDLAAMGAEPAWFTLAITLPEIDEPWLRQFCSGLATLAVKNHIQLVGGDTTRGPLAISIQVHGLVSADKAVTRDGAKVGDDIYVTGALGDAGAALWMKLEQLQHGQLTAADKDYLLQRLLQPEPRNTIGCFLTGRANAAIDISDGLVADLGHILERSHVGARLELDALPLSTVLQKLDKQQAQQLALSSGDDYELCFTIAPELASSVEQQFPGQVTRIGQITAGNSIEVRQSDEDWHKLDLTKTGYDHFQN